MRAVDAVTVADIDPAFAERVRGIVGLDDPFRPVVGRVDHFIEHFERADGRAAVFPAADSIALHVAAVGVDDQFVSTNIDEHMKWSGNDLEPLPVPNSLRVGVVEPGEIFPRQRVLLGDVSQLLVRLDDMRFKIVRLWREEDACRQLFHSGAERLAFRRDLPVATGQLLQGLDVLFVAEELFDFRQFHQFVGTRFDRARLGSPRVWSNGSGRLRFRRGGDRAFGDVFGERITVLQGEGLLPGEISLGGPVDRLSGRGARSAGGNGFGRLFIREFGEQIVRRQGS